MGVPTAISKRQAPAGALNRPPTASMAFSDEYGA